MKNFILILLLAATTSYAGSAAVAVATNNSGIKVYKLHQDRAMAVVTEFLKIERSYLYVREKTGHNDGVEVEMFLASVGLPKGYSWCASFVSYCYKEACLAARSRVALFVSPSVLTMYQKTIPHCTIAPMSRIGDPGSIMFFRHGNTPNGHVATVTGRADQKTLSTIEGNTGPERSGGSVQSQRDGDGVYARRRPVVGYPGLNTIGFIVLGE